MMLRSMAASCPLLASSVAHTIYIQGYSNQGDSLPARFQDLSRESFDTVVLADWESRHLACFNDKGRQEACPPSAPSPQIFGQYVISVVRDALAAPLDVPRQKGVATEKRPRWTRPLDGKYKTGREVAVRPAPLVPEKPREEEGRRISAAGSWPPSGPRHTHGSP